MHLLALLTLLPAALASSLGFTIPSNLEDGFYTVTFPSSTSSSYPLLKRHRPPGPNQPTDTIPSDNEQNRDPVAAKPPPFRTPHYPNPWEFDVVPFNVSSHECRYNRPPLLQRDWAAARSYLASYCDIYLLAPRTRHLAIAKSGHAVAYACNWDAERTRSCSGVEMEWIEYHWLDPLCGELQVGWADSERLMRRYGRSYPSDRICDGHGKWMEGTAWVGEEMPEGYGGYDKEIPEEYGEDDKEGEDDEE